MMNVPTYKGYTARVEIELNDGFCTGTTLGLKTLSTSD